MSRQATTFFINQASGIRLLKVLRLSLRRTNQKRNPMAVCIPFLGVQNIELTVLWYESLGFQCTGSNRYWDPGAELTWAQLEWEGAAFMVFPFPMEKNNVVKDAGLFFRVASLRDLIERLKTRAKIIELLEEPFSSKKEVVFEDVNGFRITFTCG